MGLWAVPAALGALGALSGSQSQTTTSGLNVSAADAQERQAGRINTQTLGQLNQLVGQGPGQAEVQGGLQSANAFAAMLDSYSKGNFLPNAADFQTANQFTQEAFRPQQTAINQQFVGEQQRAAQMASQLGREVNDPIIQAKLSQERMQAQERLGSEQSAYSSQFALNLPQQRLGYMSQLADVKNSLASQAMANRQALLSMGQQQQQMGQNWRLNTASRYQSSGGGMQGALNGGIAGFGAGLSAMGGVQQLMGNQNQLAMQTQQMSQPQMGPQIFSQPQLVTPQMQAFASAPAPQLANPFPQFAQPPQPSFNYLGQANPAGSFTQSPGSPYYKNYNFGGSR